MTDEQFYFYLDDFECNINLFKCALRQRELEIANEILGRIKSVDKNIATALVQKLAELTDDEDERYDKIRKFIDNLRKKNLLIIGVNGFIGRHCFRYFSDKGEFNVYGCDITPFPEDINFILIDSYNPDFNYIFENLKFHVCINCSGAANVPLSLDSPLMDFELNTGNVFKLLNAIRLFNPECKFINLSSAAVYGNPSSLPIKESDEVSPVSPYGYHKLMAEMICKEFNQFWDLKTLSLRIFSAYGPGLKKQIFWDISQKLSKSNSLELFGTGEETRDFIYVDDLVKLIDLFIKKAKFDGEIVNAANGNQTSISTVASITRDLLKREATISFNHRSRKGDPLYWEADITKAKEYGYSQTVNLNQGIKNYTEWLKENGLV